MAFAKFEMCLTELWYFDLVLLIIRLKIKQIMAYRF